MGKFNVLNTEGEKIVVDTIDPQIHKHVSGREFNEDDACVKTIITQEVEEIKEDDSEDETTEEVISDELNEEQAIEAYTEKYGRKPHPNAKLETIISKL